MLWCPAQVGALSRALAIRTLQLELEYIYGCLEDEALDIGQGTQNPSFLLSRQVMTATSQAGFEETTEMASIKHITLDLHYLHCVRRIHACICRASNARQGSFHAGELLFWPHRVACTLSQMLQCMTELETILGLEAYQVCALISFKVFRLTAVDRPSRADSAVLTGHKR